jgi:hypothetical protein
MSRLTPANHAELEEQGYTVVPKVYTPELCGKLRRLMDDILGPPAEHVDMWWQQSPSDREGARHVVQRCLQHKKPIITSSPYIHNIRHPV